MNGCDVLPGGESLNAALAAEIAAPDVIRVTLAPGYLFVPGLAPLWAALEASPAPEIRMLTGNSAGLLTVEQRFVAESEADLAPIAPALDFAASARAERDRVRDEVARALRENLTKMAQTPAERAFLLSLARAIGANRVRVRVYSEGRLHTKAAIVEKASGVSAFVGTTNVTLPIAANPTQINLRVTDSPAVQLSAWATSLWDNSQDFTRALFAELSAHLT